MSGSMPVRGAVASGLNGARQLLQPVGAVGLACQPRVVDEFLAEQHMQQGQQQVGVAVGNDAKPLELRGGLGLSRIDDQHASAALDDVVHAVLDPWHGQHAPVGHDRVRADDDEQVGAKHVGDRQCQRRAVEQLAGHEAVVDVLTARGEHVQPRAEPGHEHRQAQDVRIAEGAGVAVVPADRPGSVPAMDVGQPLGDIGHRLVPADGLEAVGRAAQRGGDAVRVVDDLGEGDALLAREPRRQRVILIGTQRGKTAVFDGRDHAA